MRTFTIKRSQGSIFVTLLALVCLVISRPAAAMPLASDELCFNPRLTSYCVIAFRTFWEENGGLPVFGYPITAERPERNADSGRTLTAQWFERNRLEAHPENAMPYDVLLGRLGADRLAQMGRNWQAEGRESGPKAGCLWFEQTGHNVCDYGSGASPADRGFKSYWTAKGLNDPRLNAYQRSLALHGLPLTSPRMETNSSGDTVLTQWFERGRFEWHPNNPQGYRVLLGLLGSEVQFNQSQPPIRYLNAGRLYELRADGSAAVVQDVPDMGKVLDAVDSDGRIVMLRERGLQRLDRDRTATTIATFTKGAALFGSLVDPADSDLLIYSYSRESPESVFFEGVAGTIERGETARKVLDAPNSMRVLGLTTDSKAMYLIDQGGDPSFVGVRIVQLPGGETLATPPFGGEGAAAESPDRRTIVSVGQRNGVNDVLNVYDLTSETGSPRVLSLPHRGWYAADLIWARDNRSVYVTMYPNTDQPTGELYRVDVATGNSQLLSPVALDARLLSFAPNGHALLMREQASVIVLDVATGAVQRSAIPVEAVVARWH